MKKNRLVMTNYPMMNLQNVFIGLHDECLNLSRICTKQNKIISSLESKTSVLQNELEKSKTKIDIHISSSTCKKRASLESKVVELNKIIGKYEKEKHCLDNVLSSLRYSNARSGLV